MTGGRHLQRERTPGQPATITVSRAPQPTLSEESNLYEAGLSSHASVTVMLALEERFDIEFPERMLRRGAFASITAIREGLEELIGAGQ